MGGEKLIPKRRVNATKQAGLRRKGGRDTGRKKDPIRKMMPHYSFGKNEGSESTGDAAYPGEKKRKGAYFVASEEETGIEMEQN